MKKEQGKVTSVRRSFIKAPGDENSRPWWLQRKREEANQHKGIVKTVSAGYGSGLGKGDGGKG